MIRIILFCIALAMYLNAKMTVSVSILPQAFFVKSIAGDLVDVNVMIEQGTSPEVYEPSINQIKELTKSSAYFLIGMPFEDAWKDKFKNANEDMLIVPPLEDGVFNKYMKEYNINNHHKHFADSEHHIPHIWMSFILSSNHIKVITKTLQELDPNNKEKYEKNLNTLLESINKLFLESKQLIKNSGKNGFLVYHPAFNYIANELGIIEYAIEQDGKEAKISHMQEILNLVKMNNIKTILIQPQFSKKSAMVIAKEANLDIKIADPLRYDWLDNMKDIIKVINSH